MTLDDDVLRELHRAAATVGRRGISIPSIDLGAAAKKIGGRKAAEEALGRLARAKRVTRVRRDLVVLPDATGLVDVRIENLIDVITPEPYLITGGAALERASLTGQHFFGIAVLTPSRVAKLEWRSQHANFFVTDPSNIWGDDDTPGPRFASPERAVIDALNHPRYGVPLAVVLEALKLAAARDEQFLGCLVAAVERYGAGRQAHSSRAAARRVGLVVERLFGERASVPYLDLIGANEAPALLRPGGKRTGEVDRRWRVLVNAAIEPEEVA